MGRQLKDAMAPMRLRNLRDAQKVVEAAVNMILADTTTDKLSTARLMLEAAKVTSNIEALSIDRKIEELRAELQAFTGRTADDGADGPSSILPLALPAPLGGHTGAVDEAIIVPLKRGRGRPRKHPLATPPFIPTPDQVHDAFAAFVSQPDAPDEPAPYTAQAGS